MLGGEFIAKTAAEQRLEHLGGLKRPLSDAESAELQRAMHAVYCREWKRRREFEPA